MNAANIMTKNVLTLSRNRTMLDALRLVGSGKIRQVPVVDSEDRVIGVITPRRLMKGVLPKYVSEGMIEDVRFAPELPEFVENIDALAKKNIDEVLEKDYVSVKAGTHTMEVAALFINPRLSPEAILVLDDNKRLLGIISPWDIFKRLTELVDKR